MRTWWRSPGAAARDAGLAGAMAVLALVPGSGTYGVVLGDLPQHRLDALGVALVLGQCLPLAVRRSRPGACLAVVGAAFAAHELVGYPSTSAGLCLFIALYSAGAHLQRHRRATAAAAAAAYAVLALGLHGRGSPEPVVGFLTFSPVLVACWGTGAWVRARALVEATRRRLDAQQAIAQERARIARDLHDVVTHHVTAMVVQAEATQFLLEQPERVATGLSAISGTGRQAMAELRHLLGVLHAPDAPGAHGGPGASAAAAGPSPVPRPLGDLVGEVRSAGQPVHLVQSGRARPVDAGVELAAYRVVQEGLTNALKHAPGRPTLVQVDYGEDAVDVEVSTDGPAGSPLREPTGGPTGGPAAGPAGGPGGWAGSGRGLSGLRERVGVVGGQLVAGARPGGGFTVRARIPLQGRR